MHTEYPLQVTGTGLSQFSHLQYIKFALLLFCLKYKWSTLERRVHNSVHRNNIMNLLLFNSRCLLSFLKKYQNSLLLNINFSKVLCNKGIVWLTCNWVTMSKFFYRKLVNFQQQLQLNFYFKNAKNLSKWSLLSNV